MKHSKNIGFNVFIICVLLIILLLGFLIIRNEREKTSDPDRVLSTNQNSPEEPIYTNFIDRYNSAVDCDVEYNRIVTKLKKFNTTFLTDYFSKEYSATKKELISKSRECESLWLQVKLFLEDNRAIVGDFNN